jgi:precorrin-6B methylase 2
MKERRTDEFYKTFQKKGKYHFKQLYFANKKKFLKGCGSYLFDGHTYSYDKSMYEKQKLLFDLCKTNNKILEIGNYMGHSILIMLLANPKIHITAIDISDRFAKPSLEYLQKEFPESKINLIVDNSLNALNNLKERFDLFHLDGTHRYEVISKEFLFLLNLSKNKNVKILFDDVLEMRYLKYNILKNFSVIKNVTTHSVHPNFYVEIYINKKTFKKDIRKFKFEQLKIFMIKYLWSCLKHFTIFRNIRNKFIEKYYL